jgi:hypothetical protein
LGIKWPEREADYSPPYSTDGKNGGAIAPLLHTSLWCGAELIKHRDTFYIFLTCVICLVVAY